MSRAKRKEERRKRRKGRKETVTLPATPNNWSSGHAIPYQVTFIHPDGTHEFVKTDFKEYS